MTFFDRQRKSAGGFPGACVFVDVYSKRSRTFSCRQSSTYSRGGSRSVMNAVRSFRWQNVTMASLPILDESTMPKIMSARCTTARLISASRKVVFVMPAVNDTPVAPMNALLMRMADSDSMVDRPTNESVVGL